MMIGEASSNRGVIFQRFSLRGHNNDVVLILRDRNNDAGRPHPHKPHTPRPTVKCTTGLSVKAMGFRNNVTFVSWESSLDGLGTPAGVGEFFRKFSEWVWGKSPRLTHVGSGPQRGREVDWLNSRNLALSPPSKKYCSYHIIEGPHFSAFLQSFFLNKI